MEQLEPRYALIGTSPSFVRLMAAIDQISGRAEPVRLIGERGTRTELLARLLHERSPRHAQPFMTMRCGLAPELISTEFFGYEKGAFLGR